MTRIHSIQCIAAATIASAIGISCDESLPPRDVQILRIEAEIGAVDSLVNINTYLALGASAVIGSGGSITLTITSLHDEVLQGEFSPQGWVDIWLESDSLLRTRLDVVTFRPLNPDDIQGGMLTLRPDRHVRLVAKWGHRTEDGEPYWEQGRRTYVIPPLGPSYFETGSLTFGVQASIQLFGELGVIYPARTRIKFMYREHIIGGE